VTSQLNPRHRLSLPASTRTPGHPNWRMVLEAQRRGVGASKPPASVQWGDPDQYCSMDAISSLSYLESVSEDTSGT
jgi:hypothetical protein